MKTGAGRAGPDRRSKAGRARPDRRSKTDHAQRAALVALALTCLLTATKLVVWAATGSLAVFSQMLDSALDIVALLLLFLAVRVASKPADESHHYGHGKAENLAAFVQTLILGVLVVGVLIEAVARLIEDEMAIEVPVYALALFVASACVDIIRVRYLFGAARAEGSDALRAGALNFAADIGTALIALASLVAARAGFAKADVIGGLVVALVVGFAAVRLGSRSVDVLMDRAPDTRLAEIEAAASGAEGVTETRRVRLRSGGKNLFADVTVAAGRTATLERAHDIAEAVEREIARVAPGTDVVVHVEPVSETSGLVERAQAAASRQAGVHEVHNVLIHAFDEDGRRKFHVTLHAKVRPGTSLDEAHALSDRIEASVVDELGDHVRVDSHIEPWETTTSGRDVTSARKDIVALVTEIAQREPDVVDCHEVLVTSVDGQLSVVAHVRGPGNLALGRIHDASVRIEDALRAAHPEIGPVLIHFEPA
ncbi:MAG: cation diffusion facilitator family transporter [Actinomycetota bacterium]